MPVLEYDEAGAATLYEYGVGTEGAVVSLGRFAAREWAAGIAVIEAPPSDRFTLMALHPTRRILHFYTSDEGIQHIYSNDEIRYWVDSTLVQAGYDNPHIDTDNPKDSHPSAMYTANGRTLLGWVREGSVYLKYSDDTGENWSEANEVLSGYEYAFFWTAISSPIINRDRWKARYTILTA